MNMELKDTVLQMQSDNYKDRFRAEYYQLKIRYDKLTIMLVKWKAGTLEFMPDCPYSLYELQVRAMEDYLAVLEARAKIEGVML